MNPTALVLGLLLAVTLASTQSAVAEEFPVSEYYEKTEFKVPVRDGVRLHTVVYTPKNKSQRYPILLQRTPYSAGPYGAGTFRNTLEMTPSPELLRSGYIFVFQDVRGKDKSEGEFEDFRPPRQDRKSRTLTDESTDNYDTIEWLLRNLEGHTGKVGQWGHSYPAFYALMGANSEAHPALKAVSPSSVSTDGWIGDDFHFNGAFYLGALEIGWIKHDVTQPCAHLWAYEFFLNAGPIDGLHEKCFSGRPMRKLWKDFIEHPDYDQHWKDRNLERNLRGVKVPVFNVAGWFDHADPYGAVAAYHAIERQNPGNTSTLLLGPWNHGTWFLPNITTLGPLRLGSDTSAYYQRELIFPFFEYYLKGRGQWKPPEVIAFETGANRWHEFEQWPPRSAVKRNLYFQEKGLLSFEKPGATPGAHDRYVSDPNRPVPNSPKMPMEGSYLLEDQRFAFTRPDVLSYQTAPLSDDVTLVGPTKVELFVSTTGTDSDWFLKLIDVYPNDAPDGMGGYQMLLGMQVMRGKYRDDPSRPKPMVPGEVTRVSFNVWDLFHTFRKGHRLMVQVQSSFFPLLDRNPQTFTNIYRADRSQYQAATQSVFRSGDAPSHLVIGVLPPADSSR